MIGYIKKHFNGDMTLTQSFFGNFIGVSLVLRVVLVSIANTINPTTPKVALLGFLILGVISSIIVFWGAIGAFLSAKKTRNIYAAVSPLATPFTVIVQAVCLFTLLIEVLSWARNGEDLMQFLVLIFS